MIPLGETDKDFEFQNRIYDEATPGYEKIYSSGGKDHPSTMGRKYETQTRDYIAHDETTELRFSLTNDDFSSAPRGRTKITKFSE